MPEDDDITITASAAKVHAGETISTAEYESATVSTSMDVDIEGVDVTDGIPDEVKQRLYAYSRTMQGITRTAAEERRGAE